MSDTPRTDRYAAFGSDYPQQKLVPVTFARELEREADILRAKLTCWTDVANGLADAVRRLDPPQVTRLGQALAKHDSITLLEIQMAKAE